MEAFPRRVRHLNPRESGPKRANKLAALLGYNRADNVGVRSKRYLKFVRWSLLDLRPVHKTKKDQRNKLEVTRLI